MDALFLVRGEPENVCPFVAQVGPEIMMLLLISSLGFNALRIDNGGLRHAS